MMCSMARRLAATLAFLGRRPMTTMPLRSDKNLHSLVPRVLSVADLAARAIFEIKSKCALQVDTKADQSPVTEADKVGHNIIVKGLEQLWLEFGSGFPIVSEEDAQVATATAGPFWLVDPLDGTKEFINGFPDYTVNIALVDATGTPSLGVVVLPETGEAFWGYQDEQSAAAFARSGWSGDVTAIKAGPRPKRGPVTVAVSRSHGDEAATRSAAEVLFPGREIFLKPGGSSLKIVWVARGDVDAYIRLGPTHWWDTAAAHAVLRAAGGELVQWPPTKRQDGQGGTNVTLRYSFNPTEEPLPALPHLKNPGFAAVGIPAVTDL